MKIYQTPSHETNSSQDNRLRVLLAALIQQGIGGDIISNNDGGFLAIMAKSDPHVRQDIPAAFEMYTVLSHYLDKLPVQAMSLNKAEVSLQPAVYYDGIAGKLVALFAVRPGELNLIGYWIADGIRSDTVRSAAGILALPFSIETHDDVQHLIPEWFSAFYVNSDKDNCVPVLTLRSVVHDERFGDWVAVALEQMPNFGLPCAAASSAMRQECQRY
jgi:hypothetical protein